MMDFSCLSFFPLFLSVCLSWAGDEILGLVHAVQELCHPATLQPTSQGAVSFSYWAGGDNQAVKRR